MYRRTQTALAALLLAAFLIQPFAGQAQSCDPSTMPSGLLGVYTPGAGVQLQWNAIPGSVGVQIRATAPNGSTITRRLVGSELNQYFVPEIFLEAGVYTWQIQGACSTVPPFDVTPISIVSTFLVSGGGAGCPANVTDIDGNIYGTVQIGGVCFMDANLKTTHYRNGAPIPTGLNNSDWLSTSDGAYALPNGNPINTNDYGLLYNWHAVNDPRGICPTGWHVPSESEFDIAVSVIDPSRCSSCIGSSYSLTAGAEFKETGLVGDGTGFWFPPNTGASNSTGFSGRPAGVRLNTGNEVLFGLSAYWWTSTLDALGNPFQFITGHDNPNMGRNNGFINAGNAVRCVKD
jgi:uncharacterized protein (TIGR02145 family)